MQKSPLRIAIPSVLLYIIYKKNYDILSTLSVWFCSAYEIRSKMLSFSIHFALALIALFVLILMGNHYLSKTFISNKNIYLLIALIFSQTFIMGGVNKFQGYYLINHPDAIGFDMNYSFQYVWAIAIGSYTPILGLMYFMWKLFSNKKEQSQHIT